MKVYETNKKNCHVSCTGMSTICMDGRCHKVVSGWFQKDKFTFNEEFM